MFDGRQTQYACVFVSSTKLIALHTRLEFKMFMRAQNSKAFEIFGADGTRDECAENDTAHWRSFKLAPTVTIDNWLS